jgi:AbrB family looped-hinge helix DNA binding protein
VGDRSSPYASQVREGKSSLDEGLRHGSCVASSHNCHKIDLVSPYKKTYFAWEVRNMKFPEPTFYGSVTVSDRGQVVIPAKARAELNIKEGDKLLVLSSPLDGVTLVKSGVLTERMTHMQSVFKRLVEEDQAQDGEMDKSGGPE